MRLWLALFGLWCMSSAGVVLPVVGVAVMAGVLVWLVLG